MKKVYKNIFDKILDKKFSRNMQAGYDPLEVDMFLDYVREFIVKSDHLYQQIESKLDDKNKDIANLKRKLQEKDNLISILNSEIDSYKKDGYQSQKFVKDLSKLQEQVFELKKKSSHEN